MDSIWDFLSNQAGQGSFGNLALGGGALAIAENSAREAEKAGQAAAARSDALAGNITAASQFKPFTVTTGLSTVNTDPTGGYNISLSPEQQFYQNELFGTAAGLLQNATQDDATREQQIFQRMQAMSAPGQDRERLALENRLYNQGRGGVSTSMFGGTPEQLAMYKAIEEQRSGDIFGAMQQANAEQAQKFGMGSQLFGMGYMPQQQAIASMSPAINIADIAAANQGRALQSQALLGQSGIEALLTGANTAAGARTNALSSLLNSLASPQRNAAGEVQQQSIIDRALGGLFSRFVRG